MAKKCLACDLVYPGEMTECPACGKADHLAVIDPTDQGADPVPGVTRCGVLMVINGLITLVCLLRPQLGLVSLCLGLLLLVRSERAVQWVKAAQILKLAVVGVFFLFAPRLVLLLAVGESLAVLGLLSRDEWQVRLGTIVFTVLLLVGILAGLLPSLPVIGNL